MSYPRSHTGAADRGHQSRERLGNAGAPGVAAGGTPLAEAGGVVNSGGAGRPQLLPQSGLRGSWRPQPPSAGAPGSASRDREVLVEDVLGIVGGLQLAQTGERVAGERVVQPLRALVCLEAEVQAAQVPPQLTPVPVEALEVLANRADVEVLVAVRLGGGARVHVVDRAAQLFRPAAKGWRVLT